MVGELYRGAPLMGISRDDINNKVRILKGKREEEEQREVSPAIPFHIIRNPSLLTNSDLSVSDGSSGQHPLNMLASQAVQMSENTNQAQLLTLPNRCSYERCGAPLDLVPELCTYCFGYVHQICQQFAVGQGSPSSTLLCSDCCAIYGTGFDISAYAEDVVVDEEEEEEEDEEEEDEEEEEEEEVEEDEDDDNTEKVEARKKGGRPTGSTLEHLWAQKLLRKQKKTKLRGLISSAKVIKEKMKSKTYKLKRKDLLVLVRYKHSKGDQKIPSTVADLQARWNETKHRASPHCSPNNSDDEEEEDVDDEEGGEMGTTGLVFGHDESEDESDD